MGKYKNVRNRHSITNVHVLELIDECITECETLKFKIPKNLRFLECVAYRRAGLACYTVPPVIVLSTFLYKESDSAIKTVIYHELGHIIAGPKTHHGYEWQKVVNKIGQATGLTITRLYSLTDLPNHAEECKKKWKYNFRCKSCGSELHYTRLTEFVKTYDTILANGEPRWICTRCHGTFELIK